MLERASAIASGLARGGCKPLGDAGVRLGEVRGWSLLQVAGFPGGMAPVETAITAVCGMPVPARIGTAGRAGGLMLLRTGPDQIWIVAPGDTMAAESALQGALPPTSGVLVSLSHSRTRLFIEGPRARDVLAKGIPVDLHPDVFGIDRFALTGVDHTPILLHRAAADRYEIFAMRTFALTVWDWMSDAALEFGYEVATPATP